MQSGDKLRHSEVLNVFILNSNGAEQDFVQDLSEFGFFS